MSEQKVVHKTSFPILGVLGLIFITLKLTGHIAWSWWWVLAPFWAIPALIIGIPLIGAVGFGFVYVGAMIVDKYREIRRPKAKRI